MTEIRRQVDTFEVEYLCDSCGEPVEFSKLNLELAPNQYQHVCPKCGAKYDFMITYPYVKREYKEGLCVKPRPN